MKVATSVSFATTACRPSAQPSPSCPRSPRPLVRAALALPCAQHSLSRLRSRRQRTLTAQVKPFVAANPAAILGRLAAEGEIGLPRSALLSVSRIGHPSLVCIVLRTVCGSRKDAPSGTDPCAVHARTPPLRLIHASFRPEGHLRHGTPLPRAHFISPPNSSATIVRVSLHIVARTSLVQGCYRFAGEIHEIGFTSE